MSVGEEILRAWKFLGRRVVPLVGLGWLSAAFYGVAVSYFLGRLSAAILVWPRPDAGGLNNFALFYLFCLVVVTAFANAVMGIPMALEALESGNAWKTAYFSVARREWSLFANLLLLYVIVIGLVSAILFAGGVGIAVSLPMIGTGGVWNGIALAPIMSGTLTMIAVAVGLFLAARFGFFLTPVAVADPPARLLQAWTASRGNFWRLLSISLALLVPVIALSLIADWATLGAKFGEAIVALFSEPHNLNPFFQLIHDNTGSIATIWAIAFFVWNAIFAGASVDAYARMGHGAEAATSHEYPSVAEPAFAMAAASSHMAVVEVERAEPVFSAVEKTEPATPAPPEESNDSLEQTISENRPEPHLAEIKPAAATERQASEVDRQAEEIEFKTVEDPPPPLAVEPIALPDDASAISEGAHTEAAAAAVSESHEEPLAPQESLPPVDPLDHAAPAAPDPAGAETTPLPSFVKAQSSPEHEPSEAA